MLIAIEAGILMTDEVTKFCAGTPRLMYAANTDPEMVENPNKLSMSAVLQIYNNTTETDPMSLSNEAQRAS